MKHFVTFQSAYVPSGGADAIWMTLWEVWGKLETLYVSSSEKTRLALDQNATHRFVMHYDKDKLPKAGMRMTYDARTFLVRMVTIQNEARAYVSILLQECMDYDEMGNSL